MDIPRYICHVCDSSVWNEPSLPACFFPVRFARESHSSMRVLHRVVDVPSFTLPILGIWGGRACEGRRTNTFINVSFFCRTCTAARGAPALFLPRRSTFPYLKTHEWEETSWQETDSTTKKVGIIVTERILPQWERVGLPTVLPSPTFSIPLCARPYQHSTTLSFMYVSFLSMYIPTPLSTAFRLPHRLQDQSNIFQHLDPPPHTLNCAETSRVGVPTRFRGALQPQQIPKEDETTRRGAINTTSKQKCKQKKKAVSLSRPLASLLGTRQKHAEERSARWTKPSNLSTHSTTHPPTHPKRNPEILHSQPHSRLYTCRRNQPYRGY